MSSALKAGDAVVVTGAGQGLGRGISLRLAREGARLALWDIAGDQLEITAHECRAFGIEVHVSLVDVGNEKDVQNAAELAVTRFGEVFGLVNNAGIFPRMSVLNSSTELWERVLRVNLLGSYFCARMLCPFMLRAGRGAVVNIASGAALRGYARGAHYAASKAGLLSFTKSLALELAPTVRVNSVMPGLADTAQPLQEMSVAEMHAQAAVIPLGRIARPDDVGAVTAFLLGADAAFMTGQAIAVNGGSLMVP